MKRNAIKEENSDKKPARALRGKMSILNLKQDKIRKPKLPKKNYPTPQRISDEDLEKLISVTGLPASEQSRVRWTACNRIRFVLFEYHSEYRPAHRWEWDEIIYNIHMLEQHVAILIDSLEHSPLGRLRDAFHRPQEGELTFDINTLTSNLRQLSELAKKYSLLEGKTRIGLDAFHRNLAYFVGFTLSDVFLDLFGCPAGSGENGPFIRFALHILNDLNTDPKKTAIAPTAIKSALIQYRTGSLIRGRVAKTRKK